MNRQQRPDPLNDISEGPSLYALAAFALPPASPRTTRRRAYALAAARAVLRALKSEPSVLPAAALLDYLAQGWPAIPRTSWARIGHAVLHQRITADVVPAIADAAAEECATLRNARERDAAVALHILAAQSQAEQVAQARRAMRTARARIASAVERQARIECLRAGLDDVAVADLLRDLAEGYRTRARRRAALALDLATVEPIANA